MNPLSLLDRKAPAFSLPDQQGTLHTISQYHGKWVVLYFYPRDDTPGCTKEACSFQDNLSALQKKGIVVLGVSADSSASHAKFAEKYHLRFPLLSDEEKKVIMSYGTWGKKQFMGKEYMGIMRTTFIINPQGTITKVYEKVKPEGHAAEILQDTLQ